MTDQAVNSMFRTWFFLLSAALVAHASDQANDTPAAPPVPGVSLSDPIVQKTESRAIDDTGNGTRYLLSPRDNLKISVQGEEINAERRIDGKGELNVPLLGGVKVAGLTIEEAQEVIAKRYRDAEIFVHPEVVVSVVDYSPRDVVVLGQVTNSGKVHFRLRHRKLALLKQSHPQAASQGLRIPGMSASPERMRRGTNKRLPSMFRR